ncbi:MAG: acyltransferase family protein, partial [Dokdonella sp.]
MTPDRSTDFAAPDDSPARIAQADTLHHADQMSPWNRLKRAVLHAPLPLADGMAQRSDNILWIRHIAAALVIFSHSFALSALRPGDVDPLAALFPGLYSGIIAVYIFFIVSGVLVTTSHIRNRNTWRFAASRVLRVAPAFWACLLVVVFGFGPLFTNLSAMEYFSAAGTWDYLRHNVDFIALQWTLPGVFTGNPRGDCNNSKRLRPRCRT